MIAPCVKLSYDNAEHAVIVTAIELAGRYAQICAAITREALAGTIHSVRDVNRIRSACANSTVDNAIELWDHEERVRKLIYHSVVASGFSMTEEKFTELVDCPHVKAALCDLAAAQPDSAS